MHELKEKYIQFCCDFYNEHAPEDKIWFGRMFDDCHQEHNKRNSSMYRWQFPLMILKSQQAEIKQLKTQLAVYKEDMQKDAEKIGEYGKLTTSIRNEFDLWSDDSEFADVVEAQIENLEALRGEHDSFSDVRQKVEDQINNGACITKHQIDL